MNIKSTNYNNKISFTFKGGLNKSMMSAIDSIDIIAVQNYLKKYNVDANFENNKVISWSVLKVFEIFKSINKSYNLNLKFPQKIEVSDLTKFDNKDFQSSYGFCNFLPSRLNKHDNKITPAMSIIFNKDLPWDKINEISDYDFYINKNTATDFFLEPFFHEFSHIFHEGHILDKNNIKNTLKKLMFITDDKIVLGYKESFGSIAKQKICSYAQTGPLDLVACDMSKRFITNLDKNSLLIRENPFKDSPYQKLFFFKNVFNSEKNDPLNNLIKYFYDGNINRINKSLFTQI